MLSPKKILIIQLKRAGDILVTTPILPLLKSRCPEAEIDFLVEKPFVSLLEHHPLIHAIQRYDKADVRGTIKRIRQLRFDWVFDFQCSPRSAVVTWFSGASLRGGYSVPFWGNVYNHRVRRPGGTLSVVTGKVTLLEKVFGETMTPPARQLHLTEDERSWGLSKVGRARTVGLIPTHRRDSRRWTAQGFIEVGCELRRRGFDVLLFWGPGEEADVRSIERQIPGSRMIPKTSFREMASLLAACLAVVTNDNGPMHLAVSVGTPTVTIYGPTEPTVWNPCAEPHQIVRAEGLRCLGCNLNACPFAHECMTRLHASSVLAALDRALTKIQVPS